MRSAIGLIAVIGMFYAASGASAGLIIDDFEAGAFSLPSVSATTVSDTQASLPPSNVIGGRRQVDLFTGASSVNGDSTVSLDLTGADDSIVLSTGSESASVRLHYGTNSSPLSPAVDFTGGGVLNRIEIEISQTSVGTTFGLFFEDSFGELGTVSVAAAVNSPATIVVPYGDILSVLTDLDLTSITEFNIGFGMPSGRIFAISRIEAVPEPSTASLLALGLVGIAAVRRHRAA